MRVAVMPLDVRVRALLERFGEYVRNDSPEAPGWTVRCPVHHPDDEIWAVVNDDGTLRACASGCEPGAMLEALEARVVRQPGEDDDNPAPAIKVPMSVGVADFFATCKDSIEWLLEPYVCKGGFTLIQGAPKSGKTWLAAWITSKVAQNAKVLFVEEEGAAEVLRDRLKPFVGDGKILNGNLLVAFRKRIKLDLTKSVDALIAEVKRTGAVLVVLDPFIALHSKREKESDEMAMVLDAVRQLITETGCAVLLLHHTRKGDSWSKSSTADATSEDARGSGALVGDVDHVIAVRALAPARRKEGEVGFYVENPDTRLNAPFAKKLVTIQIATGSLSEFDAAAGADPEARAVDLLARLLPLLPTPPASITRNKLRIALRVRKDAMLDAVDLGLKRGCIQDNITGISALVPGTTWEPPGTTGTGNVMVVPAGGSIGNQRNHRNRGQNRDGNQEHSPDEDEP